jgi:AmmeMemoRadiSam system protein B
VDLQLVDRIASLAGDGARMEDYAHAVEHSIEFQVVFLQHLYGPDVRIVPILCGPFLEAMRGDDPPEGSPGVARMIDALRGIAVGEKGRVLFVLGVDMAHVGRRYGDRFAARAGQGAMDDVAAEDRSRLELVARGDAPGFWRLVRENRDPLKWCGASPLYTFLAAVPGVTGELLRYEQWNIDDQSVVSFAGLAFRSADGPAQTKGYA